MWRKGKSLLCWDDYRQALAGRNIQEANALQQHYEMLNDQQADRERSAILALAAVLFSILSLASFLIDWQNFAQEMRYADGLILIVRRTGIALVLVGFCVAVGVASNAFWGARIKRVMARALDPLSRFWRAFKVKLANNGRSRPRGRREGELPKAAE